MIKISDLFSSLSIKQLPEEQEDLDPDSIKKYCKTFDIPFQYKTIDGPFTPHVYLKDSFNRCHKALNFSLEISRKFLIFSKDKHFLSRDNPRLYINIEPSYHKLSLNVWHCNENTYDFNVLEVDGFYLQNDFDSQKIKDLILSNPLTSQELYACHFFNSSTT